MTTPFLQDATDASNLSEPIFEDITELCDFCVELAEDLVTDPGTSPDERNLRYSIKDLTDGSGPETCRLCEIITRDVSARGMQGKDRPPLTPMDWKKSSPTMVRLYSARISGCDTMDPHQICGVSLDDYEYSLWADEASSASATLINQPPIHLDLGMSKVCDLAQQWRMDCSAHARCAAEADVALPSRVLALCGIASQPSVKLVESNGRQGRYVALSHCWGSVERPPLRTTSENFQAHRDGISFLDLPKTFQDAVEFAQGIGIRHIWIDSLCIVQDNHNDWLSEAAKMGDVYRNATLVVAASGAKNSSEGLFITDRSPATVLRLPYRVAGEVKGTFNMMRSPTVWDWHPAAGPLDRRAWTLQERYLARRLVTFMPKGITWICKTTSVTEIGRAFDSFDLEEQWLKLLQWYTRRNLTHPLDRTEALRGIAEEVQRSRKDQYNSKYGVWEDKLGIQLLWTCVGPYFDDGNLHDLPSWSWAKTKRAKRWPQEDTHGPHESIIDARELSSQITITSAGNLRILGQLSTQQALSSVPYHIIGHKIDSVHDMPAQYKMQESDKEDFRLLTDTVDSGKKVLGLARNDGGERALYTHIWLVLRADHKRHPVENEAGILGDVSPHADRDTKHIYWALMLEKVDEGRYKRVGVAILLSAACEALEIGLQEFEIV